MFFSRSLKDDKEETVLVLGLFLLLCPSLPLLYLLLLSLPPSLYLSLSGLCQKFIEVTHSSTLLQYKNEPRLLAFNRSAPNERKKERNSFP